MAPSQPTLIDESANVAGCHKIAMANAVVRHAKRLGFGRLTTGSCGNYGLALALAARANAMATVVCIPKTYSSPQIKTIQEIGANVIRHGDCYEDAVAYSRQLAAESAWADCNPGGPFDTILVDGLASRIERRVHKLLQQPEVLWLPLGNGTTALAALHALDRSDVDCRVVAVTSLGNNSVLSSWHQGRYEPLTPGDLRETSVNEPLCNWNAAHGPALLAKADSRLSVVGASDDDLIRAATTLGRLQGVRFTPSGSAGYAGYANRNHESAHHAILLTARDLRPGMP